ncbi:hypothetical protein CSKR_100686 [Clonorchis sinensis]|uniref:Uncharacterized protein n=1 Tax=Clonorchis sinensis TaxID=79923 RepID=A0A3R7JKU6_CLOSI|nr:hypothetical protein CSKR_100686 [Clonorchis sinensis]
MKMKQEVDQPILRKLESSLATLLHLFKSAPCLPTSRRRGVRRNSTQIPLYRPQSGAASAKKPIPHKIGQEFETLAGSASSPDLIGRKSGPNSQS